MTNFAWNYRFSSLFAVDTYSNFRPRITNPQYKKYQYVKGENWIVRSLQKDKFLTTKKRKRRKKSKNKVCLYWITMDSLNTTSRERFTDLGAKFPYHGSILGSSQFTLLPQMPLKWCSIWNWSKVTQK